MTATVPVVGMPQPPASLDLTTTSRTDFIENDTDRLFTVTSLTVSNDSSSAAQLRLELTDDDSSYSHVWFSDIAAESSKEVAVPIYIFPGWTLVATAETGNALLLHGNFVMSQEPTGS